MIEAVMLWNEPNNLSHWDRNLDPDWDQFSEMICLAGERIARAAPGLTRVLGGMSPIDPWFIANLFSKGVAEAVDAVAVHGFPLDWNRWHVDEWPMRLQMVRDASQGKQVWATEVGASSFVSPSLQAWALGHTAELLLESADRVYWYALMDLPVTWEAVTRHRDSEGSSYFRHFYMGVYDAEGRPKPAAQRLAAWARHGLGVCEWVYWREGARLERMVRLLKELGVRRVRTGLGWADWDRPGQMEWFDHVMAQLADFEVTLTLCFTPARLGRQPNHTSPPAQLEWYADFCEGIVRRYAGTHLASPSLSPRSSSRS